MKFIIYCKFNFVNYFINFIFYFRNNFFLFICRLFNIFKITLELIKYI